MKITITPNTPPATRLMDMPEGTWAQLQNDYGGSPTLIYRTNKKEAVVFSSYPYVTQNAGSDNSRVIPLGAGTSFTVTL